MSAAKTITDYLAENLRRFMEEKAMTQAELAKKAEIGQTTVSLYLDPGRRKETHSGRAPSPTLAALDKLASALGIQIHELLMPPRPSGVKAAEPPPPPYADRPHRGTARRSVAVGPSIANREAGKGTKKGGA